MALRWNKNWQGIWISLPIRRMPDTIFLKLYRIKQIIRKCFVVDCFLITSTCPPLDHIDQEPVLPWRFLLWHRFLRSTVFWVIFVVLPSSSLYVDEDFSILGALSLDVFVISYKNTIPGASRAVCVTWPPCREINMAAPRCNIAFHWQNAIWFLIASVLPYFILFFLLVFILGGSYFVSLLK